MSFTVQIFLLFLAAFFPGYFLTFGQSRCNNPVIVAGSCIFYGWCDWRLVLLFAVTTVFDFYISHLLAKDNPDRRRLAILWCGITLNLLMLGFFKYASFIAWNLEVLFNH